MRVVAVEKHLTFPDLVAGSGRHTARSPASKIQVRSENAT